MKKILLVDDALTGHHRVYLKNIVNNIDEQFVIALPENDDDVYVKYNNVDFRHKKFGLLEYTKYLKRIAKIAKEENVDIIHFLSGDSFFRYFGLFLKSRRDVRVVITFHKISEDWLHLKSFKCICKHVTTAVVHSTYLQTLSEQQKLNNVTTIFYPSFCPKMDKKVAREKLSIPNDKVIIGAIGGTRKSKNLGLLLEALRKVSGQFHLVIAGKPEEYDSLYIEEHTREYAKSVTVFLRELTDDEYATVVNACDIIAIPYSGTFNGASGPLCDGVYTDSFIIGSEHGNIGDTIRKNHLGYTFKTDDSDSLASVVDKAITIPFERDEKYFEFQKKLAPKNFAIGYKQIYENSDKF